MRYFNLSCFKNTKYPHRLYIPISRTDIVVEISTNKYQFVDDIIYWLERNIGENDKDFSFRIDGDRSLRHGDETVSVRFNTKEDAIAFKIAWS